jgi:DNA ligase-1
MTRIDATATLEHGTDYAGQSLAAWQASEKFDGVRAWWDGATTLYSRSGIACAVPASWRDTLPALPLDCELYDGHDGRMRCASAVKSGRITASMRLIVHDAPSLAGDWLARIEAARRLLSSSGPVQVAEAWPILSTTDAVAHMRRIVARGGEGLMLRVPCHQYRPGRSARILKLKPDPDGIGHGIT